MQHTRTSTCLRAYTRPRTYVGPFFFFFFSICLPALLFCIVFFFFFCIVTKIIPYSDTTHLTQTCLSYRSRPPPALPVTFSTVIITACISLSLISSIPSVTVNTFNNDWASMVMNNLPISTTSLK